MSKKLLIVGLAVISFLFVPLAVFAYDDSFSLPYGTGVTHTSKDKNLAYDYPYITFSNHNTSVDAELAASVRKKGLFGYTLKERQQKWVKNVVTYTYYYAKHGSGTYQAVFVVNQMNGSGYVQGAYLLSSREV